MQKIVINVCFGGFGLSHEAVMEYAKIKGIKLYAFVDKKDENRIRCSDRFEPYTNKIKKETKTHLCVHYATKPLKNEKYDNDSYFSTSDIERNDPALIKAVEKLKKKANGCCAELKIVEIPDNIKWEIDEYDGNESVEEVHDSWR
jgi:hypothetical protein